MLIIHCPVCKQEFTSEMSMRSHHRNLHDCARWAEVFEKTLIQEALVHPDKVAHVEHVLGEAKAILLDKARSRKEKAKTGLMLKQHIEESKDKWLKHNGSK